MKNVKKLDLMSTKDIVDLLLHEEQNSLRELKKQKSNITKAVNVIIKKLHKGRRIVYVGAGTSGRLGILDASECRPTFGTKSFCAIIAGGRGALLKAKEGAEDSTSGAISDLKKLKLTKDDVVVAISASGETIYTTSALRFAKKQRSTTIAITSNPDSTLSRIAHYKIAPQIQDEIINGSTRLCSGTAQKIILNMLSSISMIKSGKVYGNFMIDVVPTNKKLTTRAIGIVSSVCKIPLNKAKTLFKEAKKNTKCAIVMHFKKCNLKTAQVLLKKANFNLRKVIG